MKRELMAKALIGATVYIISMIETMYVWLQVFNGNDYHDLGELILESLGIMKINASNIGQSIMLGPLLMSGYLPIFISLLIIITNTLIAIYTYKLSRERDLGIGTTTTITMASLINASLVLLLTNPWLPQVIATALAIAMYHSINNNNRAISTGLSTLIALLSPITNLLNILTPITHWLIKREFNESS